MLNHESSNGRPARTLAWGRRLDRRPGRRLMPDPVGRRPASRASLGLHVPGWSQNDLKAKPALPAARRGRSSSLAVRASIPGEPKLLQPTSYLEYGKRLLRVRPQQPPPKAPRPKVPTSVLTEPQARDRGTESVVLGPVQVRPGKTELGQSLVLACGPRVRIHLSLDTETKGGGWCAKNRYPSPAGDTVVTPWIPTEQTT